MAKANVRAHAEMQNRSAIDIRWLDPTWHHTATILCLYTRPEQTHATHAQLGYPLICP